MAIEGRALDSSPNSSSSDTIKHRVLSDSTRVRIEVRDESFFSASSATTKATATAKTPKNKKKGNALISTAVS
jgi:hypothetical protein